jgi:septal ring factor EnvC (AmiA/AmiB activator)
MTIELLNFVGGMILSGFIGLIVFLVSVNKKIKLLQEKQQEIDDIREQMSYDHSNYARDREMMDRRVSEVVDDLSREMNFNRDLDSRLDKLENRLTNRYGSIIMGE